MNMFVGSAAVAGASIFPETTPAAPSNATDQASQDAELVQAARGVRAADQAISDLHDKFGDDADSRADYHARERERDDYIATLVVVPALGADGMQAKAAVLRLRTLIEDHDRHREVAVSLADDIAERGSPALRPVAARLPDPVYAAIEAHEKAYVEVRAACAESDRLQDLADKIAGKRMVVIPDLRAGADIDDDFFKLPVAYEQDGIEFVEAWTSRHVEVYLPGDENRELREGFCQKLDEIEKARDAVYGDLDAVVNGPASAEADAVDNLIETVPTTMAGLLSFLIHLAKARRRDPELLCEQHLEPLIDGLGKAAATLS
ncbi:hypothetical protein [Bradyrhizobium icense]|uniref:Uncharacterized protein n=1 Tax=Bradyrhizobium icense TaxID=1274631 RepID=A0A1B1UHK9_9BRAD|nr:hypothetical protein [Bradyrhizobium icense]ANW02243.1 hypothetical protein LMTR13_20800 [Bradyrhizobium icense]